MTPRIEIEIRSNWANRLWHLKGWDSPDEFNEPGNCFACGMNNGELQTRLPDKGVTDQDQDLHLLCDHCTTASKGLFGADYWQWFFFERSAINTITERMLARTANLFRVNSVGELR